MTGDLTAQKAEYLEWWKLNEYDRVPKTRAGKARKLNLSPMTLINWEKTDEFQKARALRLARESGVGKSAEEVIEDFKVLMGELALDPSRPSKDRELFASMNKLKDDRLGKKETLELTADDYANIEREAKQLNIDEGYTLGEGEMQE